MCVPGEKIEFRYFIPTRIVFGSGVFNNAGKSIRDIGKKAIVVTGKKHLKTSGRLENLLQQLKENDVDFVLFDEVVSNPDVDIVDEGAETSQKNGCDFVLAMGGGSPMDTAKAIAICAAERGRIWDYMTGKRIPRRALPIVCIPTTAGTGSEVTRFSVINNNKERLKLPISSDVIYPRISFVDPMLTLSMSEEVTKNAGFDALSHAIEAYTSRSASPLTDGWATLAMKLIHENLKLCIEEPQNIKARERMSLAALLAGLALNIGRASLPHALEHPLSAYNTSLAHGRGLALLYVAWIRFSFKGNREKFARIAQILGEKRDAERCADAMEKFLQKIGITDRLSHYGFNEKTISDIVDNTYHTMIRGIKNNPLPATKEEIIEMYLHSL